MNYEFGIMKIIPKVWLGLFISIILYSSFVRPVYAAVYMMGGPQEAVTVGQEIEVQIGMDAEEERINVVDVALSLPPELQFVGFNRAASVVNLWVQEPAWDKATRTVTLVGGVPGGATGRVVLISMRLVPLEKGSFVLRPSVNSKAYLNDGLGTEAKVQLQEIMLQVEEGRDIVGSRPVWWVLGLLVIIGAGITGRKIWFKKKI